MKNAGFAAKIKNECTQWEGGGTDTILKDSLYPMNVSPEMCNYEKYRHPQKIGVVVHTRMNTKGSNWKWVL